jgi:hypothetical protein
MGLDWVLDKRKARPEFEERYATVSRMLQQMREQGEAEPGEELLKEYEEISMSCYEAVGAPQVGIDEEATEWYRKNNYEPAQADAKAGKLEGRPEMRDFWLQPFEKCLEEHKGQYVMELAEQQGGEAAVTGIAVQSIDFRGKVMRYIEGLDEDLVNEAWEDHTAEECLAYAKKLEAELPNVKEGENDRK